MRIITFFKQKAQMLLFEKQLHRSIISQAQVQASFLSIRTHLCDASQASSSSRRSLMMSELELKEYAHQYSQIIIRLWFHLYKILEMQTNL